MQTNDYIRSLFQKYIDKTINNKELLQLHAYFEIDENEEKLDDLIQAHFLSEENVSSTLVERAEVVKIKAWDKIQSRTDPAKSKRFRPFLWWSVAASVAIVLTISTYFLIDNNQEQNQLTSIYGDDVAPGSNKAVITLEDGRTLVLNDNEDGIQVDKLGIRYTDGDLLAEGLASQNATITTPKGGQYRITLSDGTKVILNAASNMTYPTKFNGNLREVELDGEAYFEVAKNVAQPFIVKTKQQSIEVLGTHFNAKAYSNEPMETTLIEGKVRLVKKDEPNKNIILQPGQQAILKGNNFKVQQVDTDEFSAWTDNIFVFNDQPLNYIFYQLERWYDVEFEYPDHIGKERFFAKVPRGRPLSNVLLSIEQVSDLKFKISGRRVTATE